MLLDKKTIVFDFRLSLLLFCLLTGLMLSGLPAIHVETMDGRFQVLLEVLPRPVHQPIE